MNRCLRILAVVAGAAAALSLASSAALATGVNVQTYTPPANSTFTLTETATPGFGFEPVVTDRRYLFGLSYNYFDDPLVTLNANRDTRVNVLVDGVQTLDAMVAMEFHGDFAIGAQMPFNFVHMQGKSTDFALGDARVFAKMYAPEEWLPFRLALIPEFRFPTGDKLLFMSDDSVGYGLTMALERELGPVVLAGTVGFRRANAAIFRDLDYRSRLPIGMGLGFKVAPKWMVNVEGMGALTFPTNTSQNPGELHAGIRFKPTPEWSLNAGASVGNVNEVSSGDLRLLAGVQYSPFEKAEKVVAAPAPKPAPAPPKPPRVVFTPKEIVITEEVKFEHDSDVLTPSSREILDEVAAVIRSNRSSYKRIHIEGHTNELGSDAHNMKLSKARARSVREYLLTRGIESSLLTAQGYGETTPKKGLEGLSRDARLAANRRVEFKVIK